MQNGSAHQLKNETTARQIDTKLTKTIIQVAGFTVGSDWLEIEVEELAVPGQACNRQSEADGCPDRSPKVDLKVFFQIESVSEKKDDPEGEG